MVDVTPYMGDLLLAKLDAALEKEARKEKPRDYLGASAVGDECSRRQWYKLQGHAEDFPAATIRRFQDGHDTEAKIIKWLRLLDGIELYAEDDGQQYGFADLDGRFRGHYDGVVRGIPQSPKTWHILEIKTANEKKFKELKKLLRDGDEKKALQEWSPRYYAQAMLYCWYEKLDRHLTIVATPGGRDLVTVRTAANATFAKSLRDKAKRLLGATEPPERIGGPDWWQCKYCSFKDMCHNDPS